MKRITKDTNDKDARMMTEQNEFTIKELNHVELKYYV